MKIQGSTQMPASLPQTEMNAVQGTSKQDKADTANGPASSLNNNERTTPQAQPRNPSSERKFEGHAVAADLNARFDSVNNSNRIVVTKDTDISSVKGHESKPASNYMRYDFEDIIVSSVQGHESKPASNYHDMVDVIVSPVQGNQPTPEENGFNVKMKDVLVSSLKHDDLKKES